MKRPTEQDLEDYAQIAAYGRAAKRRKWRYACTDRTCGAFDCPTCRPEVLQQQPERDE